MIWERDRTDGDGTFAISSADFADWSFDNELTLIGSGDPMSRSIVARTCSWIALGAVAGILCSLPAEHWVGSLLLGNKPNDPATLAEAVIALLTVALIASSIPARRRGWIPWWH
jgi:hypothetical protein